MAVVILMPHRSEMDYREWRDWYFAGLQKPPDTTYLEVRGYDIVTARNYLAAEALKSQAEYLFWLDDDLVGPPNVIEALIAASRGSGSPIASGLYMAKKKAEERGLAAWMKAANPASGSPWASPRPGYVSLLPKQAGRFIKVDAVGLGCCLIHRSVFEKTPKPWFEWGEQLGPGEDFTFFQKVAQHLNVTPVVDMDCRFWHIGTFKVDCDGVFTTLDK